MHAELRLYSQSLAFIYACHIYSFQVVFSHGIVIALHTASARGVGSSVRMGGL